MGAAATTAVVAGTAGAVHHHQAKKWNTQAEAQAYEAQQTQAQYAPQEEYYDDPPPPAAAPPADDVAAQLQQLAQLHQSGVLDDAEFAAAKQKVLNG